MTNEKHERGVFKGRFFLCDVLFGDGLCFFIVPEILMLIALKNSLSGNLWTDSNIQD